MFFVFCLVALVVVDGCWWLIRVWGRKEEAFGSREDIVLSISGFCSASVVNVDISVLGALLGPWLDADSTADVGEDILEEDDAAVVTSWLGGRVLDGTI